MELFGELPNSEPVFPKLHKIPSVIHCLMCENDDNNTCCSGITAQLVIGYEGKSYYQPHTYSRAILKSYLSSYTESVENSYEKSQENDCTKL